MFYAVFDGCYDACSDMTPKSCAQVLSCEIKQRHQQLNPTWPLLSRGFMPLSTKLSVCDCVGKKAHLKQSCCTASCASFPPGCQKDFGLAAYGDRFARAGLASFIFDYRTFGGSEGIPRHWASPSRHCEDYVSAVKYIKASLSDQVDINRISLWGYSLSGGHVLALAGTQLRDNVTAVVAVVRPKLMHFVSIAQQAGAPARCSGVKPMCLHMFIATCETLLCRCPLPMAWPSLLTASRGGHWWRHASLWQASMTH